MDDEKITGFLIVIMMAGILLTTMTAIIYLILFPPSPNIMGGLATAVNGSALVIFIFGGLSTIGAMAYVECEQSG